MTDLRATIEAAFERRAEFTPHTMPDEVRSAVTAALAQLDSGDARVAERRDAGEVSGLEIVEEPEMAELRHFSAELRPVREQEATMDD
jgi:tryptophanase